jgi:hypothetical protein
VRSSNLVVALCALGLLCPAARGQSFVGSQDKVKSGLATMNAVVAQSERLIAAHDYSQLPRQSNEFEAGLIALEQGLGSQPSALKSKLEPLIAKARVASNAMSEAAQSHRDSMLPLTHRQLSEAVSAIIASFPAALQPKPGG